MHECPEELRKSALFILNANGASLLLVASFEGQGSSKQKGTEERPVLGAARSGRLLWLRLRRTQGGPLHSAGGVPEGGQLQGSRPPGGSEGVHSGGRPERLPGESPGAQPSETLKLEAQLDWPGGGLQLPLTPAYSAPFVRGGHTSKVRNVPPPPGEPNPQTNQKISGESWSQRWGKFHLLTLPRPEFACREKEARVPQV